MNKKTDDEEEELIDKLVSSKFKAMPGSWTGWSNEDEAEEEKLELPTTPTAKEEKIPEPKPEVKKKAKVEWSKILPKVKFKKIKINEAKLFKSFLKL